MKSYTIKNTDIMHNGKIFPEGSAIDLEDKDAESLSDYLDLLNSVSSKPLELEPNPLVLNSFQDQPKSKNEHKKRSK